MSKPTIISAPCPHCKADLQIPYYEEINVAEHTALKNAILSRELFRFTCPHCGEHIPVVGPLLYHDPDNALMIYFIPPGFDNSTKKLDELLNMIKQMEGSQASEYRARIVHTTDKLIEKIHIQDAGLDDRIVELVKLSYLKLYAKDLQSRGRIQTSLFMPADETKPAQVVFILGENHDLASVDFSTDYYVYYATEYAERLNKDSELSQFATVDEKWAASFLSAK